MNVVAEAKKGGVAPDGLPTLVQSLAGLAQLRLVGLMALPPLGPAPEDSRAAFRQMAQLTRDHGLPQLSLGTTHDFEVAIEEGATHVRVGTAIFGERPRR